MTKLTFKCPTCAARFRVDSNFAGRTARCPAKQCDATFVLNDDVSVASHDEPALMKATSPQPVKRTAQPIPKAKQAPPLPRKSRVERLAKERQRTSRSRAAGSRRSSASHSSHAFAIISGIVVAGLVASGAWFAYSQYISDQEPPAVARGNDPVQSPGDEDQKAIPNSNVQRPKTLLAKNTESAAAKIREEDKQRRTLEMKSRLIPFLTKYCGDCHSGAEAEAGIPVDELKSIDQFLTERKSWEKVYKMINSGIMPPPDYEPLPTESEIKPVTDLLHDELYSFDCDLVYNPGRPTVQRLNRTEYNNTIQDLFGVDLTPADKFPADDVGEGFDNIGDVLTLPPLLMEKYLNAAEEIAAAVIDTRDPSKETSETFHASSMKATGGASGQSMGMQILASNGTLEKQLTISASGQYELTINAGADQAGDEKARFSVLLDDDQLAEFAVQEHRKKETFRQTLNLKQGKQKLGIRFLNDFYDQRAKGRKDRNLGVGEVVLKGPLNGTGQLVRSEAHRRLVTAIPDANTDVMTAAQTVLGPIMEKAFRREVPKSEVFRYAGLVRAAVTDMGESYEQGLSLAIQAILVSPDFLFRIEKDPASGETERQLDEYEVATRLSYFLWSSLPDDELFQLARSQQLLKPDVLQQQVRRMLKDDKAEALVSNFASQWLNLRNLDEISPNTDVFKDFNDDLRHDMRRETEILFSTIMKEDRSVEDLLAADYTFVNRRLAKHYGIKGINSDKFERVSLAGTNRAGVLTHASILTLTSNPGRTSPVKRGKWIMENIFGDPPPPAPPNVPELEETAAVSPELSLREQLARHREDPGCASCHKAMDPLGLGLENFNAIGQWRDKDDGHRIDASGSLPSGESFDGPLQLIQIISGRRDQFRRTLAEKMLTYALGRGTEYYDKCTIDNCLMSMKERGNRFSALVEGIVLSDPFLKKHAAEEGMNVTMYGQ